MRSKKKIFFKKSRFKDGNARKLLFLKKEQMIILALKVHTLTCKKRVPAYPGRVGSGRLQIELVGSGRMWIRIVEATQDSTGDLS
jgi:hypothetical protein